LLVCTFFSLAAEAHSVEYRVFESSTSVNDVATELSTVQQKAITGTIVDNQGVPIAGASIAEIGTSNGTKTDAEGRFSMQVGANATIRVSYPGYLEQEIVVGTQTTLNITLEEDNQALEGVVVVGYGTQKNVKLTGSVAAIKVDEKIPGRSLSKVSSGLQGLLPGLQVAQTTSMAGRNSASLTIRGLGTVNNVSPLVVVDGMPDVDINRINFADIESVSVLKDAA